MLPLLKSHFLNWAAHFAFLGRFAVWNQKTKTRRYFFDKNSVSRSELPASYYYDDRFNNKGLSTITKRLLGTFDFVSIKNVRRENFILLLHLLSEQPHIKPLYSELPEGVCPLFFPLVVRKGDIYELCVKLNNSAIHSIPWWAGYHRELPWQYFPDACYLKDHLVVLPVHQGLGPKEINFIAETLFDSL